MKKFLNSFSFTVLLMVIIALGAVAMRLVAHGVFRSAPKVEILPKGGPNGTLKVVTDIDYWPYSFIDKDGKLSGREIEIANSIANLLGMDIRIEARDWNECIRLADQHQADLVLTCEESGRECQNLISSLSLSSDDYVVFGKRKIEKVEELRGKRLAQLTYGNVNPTLEAAGFKPYMTLYPSHRDVFKAIEADEADYTVIRYTPALGILKDLGFDDIGPQCFAGRSFFCIGIDRDKLELARKVNDAILDIRINGEMNRLSEKWLTTYVKPMTFFETMSEYPLFFILLLVLLGIHATFLYRRERQEHREVQQANQRSQDALAFTNYVMDRFDSTYSVNLSTHAFTVYHRTEQLEKDYPVIPDYLESIKSYISREVHPEDRDALLAFVQPDNLKALLREKITATFNYRQFKNGEEKDYSFRAIRGSDENNVAFTFSDITDDVRKEVELQQASAHAKAFERMGGDEGVFILNFANDTRRTIHDLSKGAENYSDEEKHSVSFARYIDTCVAEADREMMRKVSSPDYVMERLKNENEFCVVYRDLKTGIQRFYEMRFARYSATEVLQSFRENDREIINHMMLDKLEGDFFALFCVDLDAGLLQVLKDETKQVLGEVGTVRPYEDAMKFLASHFVNEPKEFFERISDISYLRRRFAKDDKATFQYKSNIAENNGWATVTELVLARHENGVPTLLVIGFSLLDAERNATIHFEQALMDSLGILEKEQSPAQSIDELLALTGEFYGADRSYIFEYGNTHDTIINTYEWCRNGIKPMKEFLQNVPAEPVDGWMREFKRQGAFYMDALDSEHNTDDTRKTLKMQGIQWLVAAPILKGNEIVGFIGVDNPTKAKREIQVLRTISTVAYSEILKRKEGDEEHVTLGKLTDAFMSVYYADLSSDYMRTWKIDKNYHGEYEDVKHYSVSMGGYVREHIAERDRERCAEMTSPAYVLEQFKSKDRFSIDMTDIMLGHERNFVFDYIKVNDEGTRLVICCRDVTETLKKEKEQQKKLQDALDREVARAREEKAYQMAILGNAYSYFRINLSQNRIIPPIIEKIDGKPVDYTDKFPAPMPSYEEIIAIGAKTYVDDGYKDSYRANHNCAYLIKCFHEGNLMPEYVCRIYSTTIGWHYRKYITYLSQDENTGEIYGMTVAYDITNEFETAEKEKRYKAELEDAYNKERRQQQQLEKNMQMIGGLASSYNALYYINIDEDAMNIYALDETKYPGSRAIFEGKKKDFIKIIGGYGLSEQVHPDDRHLFKGFGPEWIREKLAGRKKWSMRFRAATAGGYRWDEMELIKYEDLNEQANAIAIGFSDRDSEIRREREYQQQLEEARKVADEANKSKTNFLFNMSHDIRTPMNAITGFTNMAQKRIDDKEKVADYLKKIDTSGQQLLTLINQVLEMARIESGKSELEENPINVREEYDKAVTVLAEQAKVHGLSFSHSLKNLTHNHLLADEAKMSSITLNITGNAMKYTPKGGCVDLALEELPPRKAGYATFVFTVADTGIGMSEEYLKVLFDPFTREKNSTVSGIQGTGLGMSIVKELVDLMGGNIEVHSQLGQGTRFDITVDFKIDEAAGIKAEDSQDETVVSFAGRRVLLVEDNELNREIAQEILGEEGLVIEEAEDGSVAVELVKANGPDYYDFILMDVQMPIMNGYEATRAIRKMYPEAKLPIIALSANAFAEDKQRSLEAGMNDHVAKPITIKELFAALAKFL